MKIFIWTDVLWDYTPGMGVAYAETLEEAYELFDDTIARNIGPPTKIIDIDTDKTPFAHAEWGGG